MSNLLHSNLPNVLNERYAIQRQLGQRVGQRTLLALDVQTQCLVVIKVLTLNKTIQWQSLKLFEREAKTLQSLNHPAIPKYLDYLDTDSPDFKGFVLVQGYIEGKSLEEQLKAGRTFSEAEVKELAIALLEVLIYLHQQSPPVIHRDIKPSNILLTNHSSHCIGQVYLVDFGSVQTLVAQEGGTITVVGTYGYMPPEQFGGRTVPASDLYSLGGTLLFVVTGRHPAELSEDGVRIQFRHLVTLTPAFVDWLEWLTEPSCDRRPSSAQAALEALETAQIQPIPEPFLPSFLLKQPLGSQILLSKTATSFNISLPAKGPDFWTLAFALLVVPLWSTWVLIASGFWIPCTQQQPYPDCDLFDLEADPNALLADAIGFSVLLAIALIRAYSKKTLQIDQKSITLKYSLFSIPLFTWLASDQGKAEHHLKLSCCLKSKPYLCFVIGQRTFQFGHSSMTSSEAEWLTQELVNWLNR